MKKEQGFIRTIIIVIIAILVVSFLGVDIKKVIDSPTTQHNFSYVTQAVLYVWNNFLKVPVFYVWEHLILPVIHLISNSNN